MTSVCRPVIPWDARPLPNAEILDLQTTRHRFYSHCEACSLPPLFCAYRSVCLPVAALAFCTEILHPTYFPVNLTLWLLLVWIDPLLLFCLLFDWLTLIFLIRCQIRFSDFGLLLIDCLLKSKLQDTYPKVVAFVMQHQDPDFPPLGILAKLANC